MPKSKIIIDDDIDFEVHTVDFEIDPDDVFRESTQPLESDAPVEVDEQNKDGPVNDGTIDASTSSVNDTSTETRLVSDFSVDYVYYLELDFSDSLIANTAYSDIEIEVVWIGDSDFKYLPDSNEPTAHDVDATTIESRFGATDESDEWYEVSDFYPDEFIFSDPDVDNVIAASGSATSISPSEHEKIDDDEILIQWIIEAQSKDITTTGIGKHQDQYGFSINTSYDDNDWADIQEFVLPEASDFLI